MSDAESLGSHQLNSFAVFVKEKLHTSSENSIVHIPQLKKMADGKSLRKEERSLKSTLPLRSLMTFMQGTARLMRQLMEKKPRMSARFTYRRLNEDGLGNGGSTNMLLRNI